MYSSGKTPTLSLCGAFTFVFPLGSPSHDSIPDSAAQERRPITAVNSGGSVRLRVKQAQCVGIASGRVRENRTGRNVGKDSIPSDLAGAPLVPQEEPPISVYLATRPTPQFISPVIHFWP